MRRRVEGGGRAGGGQWGQAEGGGLVRGGQVGASGRWG